MVPALADPSTGDGAARPAAAVVRRDLDVHAPRGQGGRPRDHQATARVIAAAQSLLAERGAGIRIEAVATRAGVGKATIYRRWATSCDLVADAVLATDPLPATPSPTDDARVRLLSLLQRLAEPLTPAEQTVAAALSQAAWEPGLHQATEDVLLAPLRARVEDACRAAGAADDSAVATATALVEGLWVRRFLCSAPLLEVDEVRAVVDDVLLALVPGQASGA